MRFDYADESDRVRYPIPRGVHIEGGRDADGDRHALLLDRSACRLYELFALQGRPGAWSAGSGATWNLRSKKLRPAGWTSADAAGLPILPLLARYGEVERGRIDHALRVTVSRSRRAYVYPARHFASDDTDPSLPRMGERLRLKAGVDISGLPRQARVIAQALKRYGLIVADNGSDWFVSGAPSPGWDNDQLRALGAAHRPRLRGRRHAPLRRSGDVVTSTRPSSPTPSVRRPASSSSSSAPTSSRRQPRSVRTSGSGAPRRAATTIGARSARAAISS